jgi:hypothetical protein
MTTVPAPAPIGLDALLKRSWHLFQHNWSVALPPLLASIVGFFVFVVVLAVAVGSAIAHGNPEHWTPGFVMTLVGEYLLFIVVVVVLSLWANVAMFGMADAVWERGATTLGDGMRAFRERGGAAFVAAIGYVGLVFAALILAIPTLGLALLALPFVTMYVFPSVVCGRRGGFESIAESFRLVRVYLGQSIIVYLVLYAIAYGISLLMICAIIPLEFSVIPMGSDTSFRAPSIPLAIFSGGVWLVTIGALIAYGGFHTIAVVGMYRDLVALPPRLPAAPLGTAIAPP